MSYNKKNNKKRRKRTFDKNKNDMDSIKFCRGSIWILDLDDKTIEDKIPGLQYGSRPILIISNNTFNKTSNVVNYVTISTKKYNAISRVHINLDGVLSDIQCEQIYTINTKYLHNYKGKLSEEKMKKVDNSIMKQLNLIKIK